MIDRTVQRTASATVSLGWAQVLPSADTAAQVAAALCSAKVVLALCVPVLLVAGDSLSAAIITATAMLVDIADGLVFGRSCLSSEKCWRERRRVYDAWTDRIVIASVLLPSLFLHLIPATFFMLVFVREIITSLVVGIPYLRTGVVYKPNLAARASLLSIGIVSVSAILDVSVPSVVHGAIVLMSLIGVAEYYRAPETC